MRGRAPVEGIVATGGRRAKERKPARCLAAAGSRRPASRPAKVRMVTAVTVSGASKAPDPAPAAIVDDGTPK